MATTSLKSLTDDISTAITFNSQVTSILIKNASIGGGLLHINFEVFVSMSGVQPNTWVDIGTIDLPTGKTLPYAKYTPLIATNGSFSPVSYGLFRISGTTLQIILNNTSGNYVFVNGVLQLNR